MQQRYSTEPFSLSCLPPPPCAYRFLNTCASQRTEFAYYTGSVGVVFDKEKFDAGLPCQRFFFGHNNDIQCLAMHPNRK